MSKATDVLFVSHGGGPMPLLGDPGHQDMVDRLTELAADLRKPSAILVISAHWEEAIPTITSGTTPSLIYDYYGFPSEAYKIEYPCPGEPVLAQQVAQALDQAGIQPRLDDQRGLDHGAFVPLKLMYPDATIPCIQLSLVNTLDASTHLAIGRALQALDYDNLLVLGSGFSFHNMRAFFAAQTPEIQARNLAFEDWLEQTCGDSSLSEPERAKRLADWEQAPHARFCHPREEHLLPLHVCYGLANKASDRHIAATILGKQSGMFYWG
ncbi:MULTISPECIES: DODA-type extradiol aromatic ring-opening family dioxygenase [Marinobacter]|jgi:aromatic ring-opening dioxygenase catalytic subunit (LigB family)|uniref:DODA-type extradiol aromatic ring-opening family dioxygenase n=1 Tax=Marinobacter TaxID=2742 RepID=UPI000C494A96|nr:class III extradiol ring-cleavage dioxygenase [Marinobacter nauticus]MAL32338.1 dioxygenase [Marinobacter sp.]MEC8898598.1 class III extradiol ring-cleavage dioxygenase [Pseudomonadota bacterium]MEC9386357.1 class III extradiol ring-cleavage dioxygenase [Pseudomonadota bacterium]|tara:strand:- start:1250 stop:2050 length:801 start_codon:yes stop_codon:yes gene_type:complete